MTALFVGVLKEFRPTKRHVLFVNSTVQIKVKLAQNTNVLKNFIFPSAQAVNSSRLSSSFFRKLMHYCNFVWGRFRIHPKYTLHWSSSHCRRTCYLPCWFARAALVRQKKYLLRLQENAHLECADASLLFTLPSSSNAVNKRSVVSLARVRRVRKMVRNLLCVFVTLFISANKTRTLAVFSTKRRP